MRPFLKWAGGKRWIVDREEFQIPEYSGRYIEPFLGGGAVFFHHRPESALLSDINFRLIETYVAIRDNWTKVWNNLKVHHENHCKDYYYSIRSQQKRSLYTRAAQFIYLNRACWNGLYRENLKGQFNVPIGTKQKIIFETDDFSAISSFLKKVDIQCCDFQCTIDSAQCGDFIFVDPPYTVAHNYNGFIKYNQNIFTWDDQLRLRNSLVRADKRGAIIYLTNANHDSILKLYKNYFLTKSINRYSVISGNNKGRNHVSEALITNREIL